MKKFKDKITLNIIIASLITIILGFSSVTSAQNFRYGAGNRFESCNERGYLPGTIQLKRGEWVKIRVLQYSGGFLISGVSSSASLSDSRMPGSGVNARGERGELGRRCSSKHRNV